MRRARDIFTFGYYATRQPAIWGSASITLGSLSATGGGVVAIGGAASITLGALTTAGGGTVAITGEAAITLGSIQLVANDLAFTEFVYGTVIGIDNTIIGQVQGI